jgi:hypothetical protein
MIYFLKEILLNRYTSALKYIYYQDYKIIGKVQINPEKAGFIM